MVSKLFHLSLGLFDFSEGMLCAFNVMNVVLSFEYCFSSPKTVL